MGLDSRLTPWAGEAFRHLPKGSPYDVLDFRFAGRATTNRWNYAGEPTLYLAKDRGVIIGEFSRHFEEKRTASLARSAVARRIFGLRLAVDRVLDLTQPDVRGALMLTDAPRCFLDADIARATAHYVRQVSSAQGLIVPSMCFLDDPSRWCLVLFLEKLPSNPRDFVTQVEDRGEFTLT